MSSLNPSVLHLYRTYFPDPPGGLQEAIRQIALSSHAQGVTNTVFTLSPQPIPRVLQRPETRVVRCRSWMAPASCDIGAVSAFTTFARLAREVDVLHYHFPWPFADVLECTVRPTTPAILTYHSDVVRQRVLGAFYSPLMWRMLHSMRVIVATSPAYARTSPVLSHSSIRDKVRIIPLGIDDASYPKVGDGSVFNRLGIFGGEPYFLFVGVLRYYKGIHFLINAAKIVGCKIIIAGSGPEGENLRKLADEIGVDNVVFAGQVTDAEKVALLQHCHALVLPSHLRSEAFGMVLVEAAMFGRPMISCEIGTGTSYVNAHEETGFVISPQSPDELARAMNVLFMDNELTARMGIAARARYEKLFSGPALGRAYSELYREICL